MSEISVRPDLEAMPPRIAKLAVDDRGYPVPWFVAWVDGKPEFRAMDASKRVRAVRDKLCWVCGEKLGKLMTFVIGPMCGINRTTAEPPCHTECAQWSARNCPFLTNANRRRREDELINSDTLKSDTPGMAITRNPGVALLWTTRSYETFRDGMGDWLIRVGDYVSIEWYANGRYATREEVLTSVETGLPILQEAAAQDGASALEHLAKAEEQMQEIYPA